MERGAWVCLCFAVGVGEVLLLGGARRSEGQPPAPAPPPPALQPALARVVIWNVRAQGDILLIRQTQTGNLYKHKRIHFKKINY